MKIIDEINSMSLKQHEFIPQINQTNKPTNELSIIHHSTFNIHNIKTNKQKYMTCMLKIHSFMHSINQSINQSNIKTNQQTNYQSFIIQHSTFTKSKQTSTNTKTYPLQHSHWLSCDLIHSFIHWLHFHMETYWMIVHKVPTFTKYQSEPNEDIHDQKLINSIIQNLFQSIHDISILPKIQTFISIMSCKTSIFH